MLKALQVSSPAGIKGKGGVQQQDGDVDVHDVVLQAGLAGSPRVPLRFQLALRAPEGQCSDLTRPFFADSHWEAEPYQRLFLQQTRSSFPRREVSGHVTGRLSVPNQSSFGELRMGPTLRDTLDTGLCCSSQGRGHIYNLTTTISRSCLLQPTIYRTAWGQF